MAVATVVSSALQINYKVTQIDGKELVKNDKFSKVKTAALDDDIFAVGNALGGLLYYPVQSVLRIDNSLITNA